MVDSTASELRRLEVWDLPTRLFHWSLLALVVLCWFTGEEENLADVHRIAGEAIAGLLVFRVIWGFVGGERARFSDFAAGPAAVIAHVRDLLSPSPKRHIGHNPLGGVAVFLLLAVTSTVVVSGLFSGEESVAGPFAGVFGLELSDVHETAFRVLQALVAVHILGVVVETWKARDALVPAMITGTKTRRADEAGADARKASVAALLFAVAAGIAVSATLLSAPPGVVAEDGRHGGDARHDEDRH
jgi:cytochrome b